VHVGSGATAGAIRQHSRWTRAHPMDDLTDENQLDGV
jgi:hypothetical protein